MNKTIALADLQHALGMVFKDVSWLEQALTHSSLLNEIPAAGPVSNERLEFLGDAILGFIVAEKLFQELPDQTEGQLTQIRAAVVSGDALYRIAISIRLGDYLLLGKGEEATGGRQKPVNLAGAVEAVIAAVYLDQGLETTRQVVFRLFTAELQAALGKASRTDHKSRLQAAIQSLYQQTPAYKVISVTGPDHARQFTVEVKAGDRVLGHGNGRSKKAAEAQAARVALREMGEPFTD